MQLNKNLIKTNFKKNFLTYEQNAIAQKESAHRLISLINRKNFNKVLEIGSYSGFLTRLTIENINCQSYLALDIVEESEFAIKKINPKIDFLNYDVEEFNTSDKFDLILSNASLQWCNSLPDTIKKLKSFLDEKGIMALSIFQKGNLNEIKDAFGVGLNYPNLKEIKNMFSKRAKIIELDKVLQFATPVEILKHLKYTGVTSLNNNRLPVSNLKEGIKILKEKYNNKITYKSVIIID